LNILSIASVLEFTESESIHHTKVIDALVRGEGERVSREKRINFMNSTERELQQKAVEIEGCIQIAACWP